MLLAVAAVRYEKKNVEAALNISNLFDKRFVAACNSETSCYYGEGRKVNLTLTYKWLLAIFRLRRSNRRSQPKRTSI